MYCPLCQKSLPLPPNAAALPGSIHKKFAFLKELFCFFARVFARSTNPWHVCYHLFRRACVQTFVYSTFFPEKPTWRGDVRFWKKRCYKLRFLTHVGNKCAPSLGFDIESKSGPKKKGPQGEKNKNSRCPEDGPPGCTRWEASSEVEPRCGLQFRRQGFFFCVICLFLLKCLAATGQIWPPIGYPRMHESLAPRCPHSRGRGKF